MTLNIFENQPEQDPDEQFIHIQQAFNGIQQWSKTINTNVALRNAINATITNSSTSAINLLDAGFSLNTALFSIDVVLDVTSPGTTEFFIYIDGQPIGTIVDAVNARHNVTWTDSLQTSAGRHTLNIQWKTSSGTVTLYSSKVIIKSYPN